MRRFGGSGSRRPSSSSTARVARLALARPGVRCGRPRRAARRSSATGFRRRHRILEDHRDLACRESARRLAGRMRSRSVARRRSRCRRRRGRPRVRPISARAGHALARARLADDAEGLAAARVENETPSTARSSPREVRNDVSRSRTSSTRLGSAHAGRPAISRRSPWPFRWRARVDRSRSAPCARATRARRRSHPRATGSRRRRRRARARPPRRTGRRCRHG